VLWGSGIQPSMLLPLLGYFFSMIAVLTAAAGMMLGFSNISTSERARHYLHPRPVVERNVTATNWEPRLFMVAPEIKDGSPAKNMEANSAAVLAEKADAKKSKPHKPKVLARQHNNYARPGHGNTLGYAEASRNGPQRLFSNW
jgi:hypothetical protein